MGDLPFNGRPGLKASVFPEFNLPGIQGCSQSLVQCGQSIAVGNNGVDFGILGAEQVVLKSYDLEIA